MLPSGQLMSEQGSGGQQRQLLLLPKVGIAQKFSLQSSVPRVVMAVQPCVFTQASTACEQMASGTLGTLVWQWCSQHEHSKEHAPLRHVQLPVQAVMKQPQDRSNHAAVVADRGAAVGQLWLPSLAVVLPWSHSTAPRRFRTASYSTIRRL
jgi:hypothetical protein